MPLRFDLTDLKLFVNVVDAGSITRGAERTHLALASASARVLAMEDTLGAPLLTRERRGVHPTPAGRVLVQHARIILQQADRMRGELGEYARGLKGHIRLLSNTAAISEHLPAALAEFLAVHPNVNVEVEERLGYAIAQAVAEGTADVGIITDTIDAVGLEIFPYREDRLVLVTSWNHPLAAGGNVRGVAIADADKYDFVGLTKGSALQEQLDARVARLGRRLNYRVRLRSFDALVPLVEKGVGLALLPEAAAHRFATGRPVRIVHLTNKTSKRELLICVRKFEELPAYTKRLVEQLVAEGAAAAPKATRKAAKKKTQKSSAP